MDVYLHEYWRDPRLVFPNETDYNTYVYFKNIDNDPIMMSMMVTV